MAQPTMDEGLQKLEEFCTLLGQTNVQLEADTVTLDNLREAIDRFEDTIEGTLGKLNDGLAEFLTEFDGAAQDAAAEVGRVGDAARSVEGRLATSEDEVQGSGDALEGRLREEGDLLEKGFAALADEGFGTVDSTLEELEAAVTGLMEELGRGFDALGEAFQQGGRRAAEEFDDAQREVDEASTTIGVDAKERLEHESAHCIAGWSEQFPDELKGQADEVGDPLQEAYDAIEEQAETEGVEVAQSFSALMEEAADFTADEVGRELAESIEQATGESLEALAAALASAVSELDLAERTTEPLGPMVDELQVVKGVLAEIDRLINAIE